MKKKDSIAFSDPNLKDTFNKPAIDSKENLDEQHSNKDYWDEIKSDAFTVCFTYWTGVDGVNWVAYSKKKKRRFAIFDSRDKAQYYINLQSIVNSLMN